MMLEGGWHVALWLAARIEDYLRARPLSCTKPKFEPERQLSIRLRQLALWLRTHHRRGTHCRS